jgi:hypothetical protein
MGSVADISKWTDDQISKGLEDGTIKASNYLKFRPMERNDRRKMILPTDEKIKEACIALRHRVEHPNEASDILLQNGIYRQKDPEAILTIKVDGVEIGYKVKPSSLLEMNQYFDRWVYLKIPGYRLYDLTNKQLASIKTAIYDAFFEPQMSKIHVKIIDVEAMVMIQRFMVAFWAPKSPGIVKTLTGVDVNAAGALQ